MAEACWQSFYQIWYLGVARPQRTPFVLRKQRVQEANQTNFQKRRRNFYWKTKHPLFFWTHDILDSRQQKTRPFISLDCDSKDKVDTVEIWLCGGYWWPWWCLCWHNHGLKKTLIAYNPWKKGGVHVCFDALTIAHRKLYACIDFDACLIIFL